jgi:hypothetical protein
MEGWRKLDNEELHNLYASPKIMKAMKPRRMDMGGACSTHGTDRNRCIHPSEII